MDKSQYRQALRGIDEFQLRNKNSKDKWFNNPAKQKVDLSKLKKEVNGMQEVKPIDINIEEMYRKSERIAKEKNDSIKIQEARENMEIGDHVYFIEDGFVYKANIRAIGKQSLRLETATELIGNMPISDVYFSIREALAALE